jgi:homogentisate 1,2-dioxygenase
MFERRTAGILPDKPHTAFYGPDGALAYEHCLTRNGFDGAYTILYHAQRPHEHVPSSTTHGWVVPSSAGPSDLSRRHLVTESLAATGDAQSPLSARVPLLFNADVVISTLTPTASDPAYFVNSDADDVFFIREGSGKLISWFGELEFSAGDYVVVPRGVLHRFDVAEARFVLNQRGDFSEADEKLLLPGIIMMLLLERSRG